MDLDYHRTLIAVADDCPVTSSVVPVARGGAKTVAVLQHELLTEQPYGLTQPDLLFEGWLRRQPAYEEFSADERAESHRQFFAKPQACLRSSPLPKRYGWGLLFDEAGRIALCPMESPRYAELIVAAQAAGIGGAPAGGSGTAAAAANPTLVAAAGGADIKVLKAMRSSRRA